MAKSAARAVYALPFVSRRGAPVWTDLRRSDAARVGSRV